jgi:molybdenum cofactor cytidylyltransferase
LSRITGILLAAGSGSRFGSDKLLHPLVTGVPIAVTSARNLRKVVPESIAVVRPGADELAGLLEAEGLQVVVCPNAGEGMGVSLACAAAAAPAGTAFLVALADMPFIRESSMLAVRDRLAEGVPLVAPFFRTRRGHPVGIGARFRDELTGAGGDEGARNLFERHAAELVKIPIGDPGVIRDIDRPSDLAPPLYV